MKTPVGSNSSTVEKERIRDQIERQVEAFLRSGGEIQVLEGTARRQSMQKASVWHGREDYAVAAD
jgi:SutA RNAP-binding domain